MLNHVCKICLRMATRTHMHPGHYATCRSLWAAVAGEATQVFGRTACLLMVIQLLQIPVILLFQLCLHTRLCQLFTLLLVSGGLTHPLRPETLCVCHLHLMSDSILHAFVKNVRFAVFFLINYRKRNDYSSSPTMSGKWDFPAVPRQTQVRSNCGEGQDDLCCVSCQLSPSLASLRPSSGQEHVSMRVFSGRWK